MFFHLNVIFAVESQTIALQVRVDEQKEAPNHTFKIKFSFLLLSFKSFEVVATQIWHGISRKHLKFNSNERKNKNKIVRILLQTSKYALRCKRIYAEISRNHLRISSNEKKINAKYWYSLANIKQEFE